MDKLKVSHEQRNKLQETNQVLMTQVNYCQVEHSKLIDERAKFENAFVNFEKETKKAN